MRRTRGGYCSTPFATGFPVRQFRPSLDVFGIPGWAPRSRAFRRRSRRYLREFILLSIPAYCHRLRSRIAVPVTVGYTHAHTHIHSRSLAFTKTLFIGIYEQWRPGTRTRKWKLTQSTHTNTHAGACTHQRNGNFGLRSTSAGKVLLAAGATETNSFDKTFALLLRLGFQLIFASGNHRSTTNGLTRCHNGHTYGHTHIFQFAFPTLRGFSTAKLGTRRASYH